MKLKNVLDELSEKLWKVSPSGQESASPELYHLYWENNCRVIEALISDFKTRFHLEPVIKRIDLYLDDPQLSSCFSVKYWIGFPSDPKARISCECVIDHPRCLLRVELGRDSPNPEIRRVSEEIVANNVGQTFWTDLW